MSSSHGEGHHIPPAEFVHCLYVQGGWTFTLIPDPLQETDGRNQSLYLTTLMCKCSIAVYVGVGV